MSERCEDLISREKAIYAVADYIHNVDRAFSTGLLSDDDCKDAAASVLKDLPSEQSEVTEEDVREWCYKRCLTIIDNALYLEMRSRWLPSAQPDIVHCPDCKYGVHSGCGDRYICTVNYELRTEHDSAFYCGYAERREE